MIWASAAHAPRLRQFWAAVQHRLPAATALAPMGLANLGPNAATVMGGIPGFFKPSPHAWRSPRAPVGWSGRPTAAPSRGATRSSSP